MTFESVFHEPVLGSTSETGTHSSNMKATMLGVFKKASKKTDPYFEIQFHIS